MLSYKQLEYILKDLDNGSTWFFMCLGCNNKAVENLNFTDLLKLPKPCQENLINFFSTRYINADSHSLHYGASIFKFIKEATGLDWELALKLIAIQNRKLEAEKDFV